MLFPAVGWFDRERILLGGGREHPRGYLRSYRTGSGLGIDRQREDCLRFARERGWEVVVQFSDNDISAVSGKVSKAGLSRPTRVNARCKLRRHHFLACRSFAPELSRFRLLLSVDATPTFVRLRTGQRLEI